MTLCSPNAKDILPRLERLAQDISTRNVEYAIDKKHVVQVAEELEATRKEIASSVERTRETIAVAIKDVVNGKIDRLSAKIDEHNARHEADMVEVRKNIEDTKPIVIAFKKGQQDLDTATRGGKIVLWLGATVSAIGGAFLVLRMIFFNH